jgi:hypothetical protein
MQLTQSGFTAEIKGFGKAAGHLEQHLAPVLRSNTSKPN